MELQDVLELARVDAREVAHLRHAFSLQAYPAGTVVFHEGAVADKCCFIRSGRVTVSKANRSGKDEPLETLGEGDFFGEIGLLEKMERTATATALSNVELYELDGDAFRHLVKTSPVFPKVLNRISRNRLLKQTALFRELSEESLAAIQDVLTEKTYAAGIEVFHQDDPPDALYVIAKGAVRILKRTESGSQVEVARLGQADFFGDMGLIETQPRSATVETLEPTKLLAISKDGFDQLLEEDPLISANMMKVLSQRLREMVG
jgi:CRP-like cAMP-binding protein